jgi:hypothetical protein
VCRQKKACIYEKNFLPYLQKRLGLFFFIVLKGLINLHKLSIFASHCWNIERSNSFSRFADGSFSCPTTDSIRHRKHNVFDVIIHFAPIIALNLRHVDDMVKIILGEQIFLHCWKLTK